MTEGQGEAMERVEAALYAPGLDGNSGRMRGRLAIVSDAYRALLSQAQQDKKRIAQLMAELQECAVNKETLKHVLSGRDSKLSKAESALAAKEVALASSERLRDATYNDFLLRGEEIKSQAATIAGLNAQIVGLMVELREEQEGWECPGPECRSKTCRRCAIEKVLNRLPSDRAKEHEALEAVVEAAKNLKISVDSRTWRPGENELIEALSRLSRLSALRGGGK